MSDHRIAVIAGDGIGREVMPEGVRVLEAAGAKLDYYVLRENTEDEYSNVGLRGQSNGVSK